MATVETTLSFQDRMSSPLKSLQKRLKDTALQTKVAKQQMQQMEATYGKSSEQAKKAARDYEKLMKTTKDLGFQFKLAREREMALIQAHDEAAKKAEENAKKTNLFEKAMNGIKNIFTGVSGRIAGSMKIVDMAVNAAMSAISNLKQEIGQSIQDFSKFQSTLTDVNNLLDRSDPLYEQNKVNLEAASRAAIKNGISIEDANTALFNSVSAIGDANTAIKTYESAQILAKAGATNLATATDGLTNVINAYRLSADEANDVSTAFFRAQVVGKTTVGELAAAIGGVAPIAKSAGVSYKELLATMSVLTKGGLDTASAATALRASMTALIKPSKQASEVLKKYGVPVGAAELQSKGLAYALVRLQQAAEANPDTLADMIPNIRALTGVSTLSADSLKLVDETIKQMDKDMKNGTGMLEAYNDKITTLEASSKRLKGAQEALRLEMGQKLEPLTTAWNNFLTTLINGFSVVIKNMRWVAEGIGLLIPGVQAFAAASMGQHITETIMNKKIKNAQLTDREQEIHTKTQEFSDKISKAQSLGIDTKKLGLNTIVQKDLYSLANYNQLAGNIAKLDKAIASKTKVENPFKDLIITTSGGKALKTQNQGKVEFAQDNLELLHDIATQKYAQYFQQLTPNLNISNMNISNEVDVDMALEAFANAITGSIQTKLA